MKIHINIVQGNRITINLKNTDNIDCLRKAIGTRFNVQYDCIHIFLNKTRLNETRSLQSYNITESSELIAYIHKFETEYEGPVLDGNFNFSSREGQEAIKNGYIMPFKAFDAEKYTTDPPDFDEKVDYLAAIGYPRKDCKSALRACYYDLCDSMQMLNGQVHPDYAYAYKEEEEETDEVDKTPPKSKREKKLKNRKSSTAKKGQKVNESTKPEKDAFESSSESSSDSG